MRLITPIEEKAPKVEHMAGLLRQRLMKEEIDMEVLQRANERGGELQDLFLAAVLRLGCKSRTASRLDLLTECQAAGIKLWDSPLEKVNDDRTDPREGYELLNYDLDRIFSRRRAGEMPWGGNMSQQAAWAKGGICTVQQALQAVMDYHSVHGHVPDHERYWWLRCSDPYGSGSSLNVRWDPGYGLDVGDVGHAHSYGDGGCLSREVP